MSNAYWIARLIVDDGNVLPSDILITSYSGSVPSLIPKAMSLQLLVPVLVKDPRTDQRRVADARDTGAVVRPGGGDAGDVGPVVLVVAVTIARRNVVRLRVASAIGEVVHSLLANAAAI